jgi:hypothetical protein
MFLDELKKTLFDGREIKNQKDVKPQGVKYER